MRSRISLPIADHPTILDSKDIMPQSPLSIDPQEWTIKQEVLDTCSQAFVDLVKQELANLYKYSQDNRIICLEDYLRLVVPTTAGGHLLSDWELNDYHTRFVTALGKEVPSNHRINLEYGLFDPTYFPPSRGIYFCVRSTSSFSSVQHEVWYIGRSKNLRNRWNAHHKFQALRAVRYIRVYCLLLEDYSDEDLNFAEEAYIYLLKPVFNRTSHPDKYLKD